MNCKKIAYLIVLTALIVVVGCGERFSEIDAAELKLKWSNNNKDTALSWWFLGEKNGYHYIMEKRPLENHGYMVSRKDIVIRLKDPAKLTLDEDDWSNLKTDDIVFIN